MRLKVIVALPGWEGPDLGPGWRLAGSAGVAAGVAAAAAAVTAAGCCWPGAAAGRQHGGRASCSLAGGRVVGGGARQSLCVWQWQVVWWTGG